MEVEEERETRGRMIWLLKKNDDYFLQKKKEEQLHTDKIAVNAIAR